MNLNSFEATPVFSGLSQSFDQRISLSTLSISVKKIPSISQHGYLFNAVKYQRSSVTYTAVPLCTSTVCCLTASRSLFWTCIDENKNSRLCFGGVLLCFPFFFFFFWGKLPEVISQGKLILGNLGIFKILGIFNS